MWLLIAIVEIVGALITAILAAYYDPEAFETHANEMIIMSFFWFLFIPALVAWSCFDFLIQRGKKRIAAQQEKIRIELETQAEVDRILKEEEATRYHQET